ncbi:MAG: hypothetical protein QM757_12505 [Paludibaculum sp.]
MHNVLKGVRGFSTDFGDALLAGLDCSLIDLIETHELGLALEQRRRDGLHTRMVPVLRGRLGPDAPFPSWEDIVEWFPLPQSTFEYSGRLVLVEVGEDAELGPAFDRVQFVLLSRDEPCRIALSGRHWYAIQWDGMGLIRQLRKENQRLVVLGQSTLTGRKGPTHMELQDSAQLRVVRAQVVWAGRDPRIARSLKRWT